MKSSHFYFTLFFNSSVCFIAQQKHRQYRSEPAPYSPSNHRVARTFGSRCWCIDSRGRALRSVADRLCAVACTMLKTVPYTNITRTKSNINLVSVVYQFSNRYATEYRRVKLPRVTEKLAQLIELWDGIQRSEYYLLRPVVAVALLRVRRPP